MFKEDIFKTMDQAEMIPEGARVVAGVSGGADSVCLLLLLKEYQKEHDFTLQVVHVEHGIRGGESLEDALFVQDLCLRLQVPCEVVHVDAVRAAEAEKLSVEEAGRKLRDQAFRDALPLGGTIALAHNEDDQAETVLLNLARGSGLQGLGGMRPVREEKLAEKTFRYIRPLLGVRRSRIEQWLRLQQQTWRTDATNLEDHYARNRIRHQVLPVLEREINEKTCEHLAAMAAMAARENDYLTRRALDWLGENASFSENGSCPCQGEAKAPELPAASGSLRMNALQVRNLEQVEKEYVLREAVRMVRAGTRLKDISRVHIQALCDLAAHSGSAHLDLPGMAADKTGDELILHVDTLQEQMPEEEIYLTHDGVYRYGGYSFEVTFMDGAKARSLSGADQDGRFPEKQYTKWLSYDKISDHICLRKRRPGDYLIIDSAGAKQKLKKYLTDRKVPAAQRGQLVLAACGSHVLWVVGMRISQGAKVTDSRQPVIMIKAARDAVS